MVFVTVGTHEQPFNRLMREIERLVIADVLEDVVVQYGYCTMLPRGCRCESFLPYSEMHKLYSEADVVICHGGASTYMEVSTYGKLPIVVPRRAAFGEHINDHQLAFARQFVERVGGIEVVEDVANLKDAVIRISGTKNEKEGTNSARFCEGLRCLVESIVR